MMLLDGAVPSTNSLLDGIDPSTNSLLDGTVPSTNSVLDRTLKKFQKVTSITVFRPIDTSFIFKVRTDKQALIAIVAFCARSIGRQG